MNLVWEGHAWLLNKQLQAASLYTMCWKESGQAVLMLKQS